MDTSIFGNIKNNCNWGWGGAVSPPGGPGRCLSEGMGVNPQTFFFHVKHAKIVMVNIG